MGISVGIVLVSHSKKLAEGVAELAGQMASDVVIVPAGGRDDGGIGTSYDIVEQAVHKVRDKDLDCAIFTDLGSATMTVEMLLDFLDGEPVRLCDAPLVEGAVAGAIAAQQGEDLNGVAAAVTVEKLFGHGGGGTADVDQVAEAEVSASGAEEYSRSVVVADASGLHARPAAVVAEMAAEADGDVLINGEDAASALLIMGLGIEHGETVTVSAEPGDQAVVDRIAEAIEKGID